MSGLTILVLTALWLLSFFGQSIFPGSLVRAGGFIYILAVVIVILIIAQFLS